MYLSTQTTPAQPESSLITLAEPLVHCVSTEAGDQCDTVRGEVQILDDWSGSNRSFCAEELPIVYNAIFGECVAQGATITNAAQLILIKDIPLKNRVLRRHEPMWLSPSVSEDGKRYEVGVEELDMEFCAESPAGLKSEIVSLVAAMWRMYVENNPSRLTPGALELKRRLLDNYSVS